MGDSRRPRLATLSMSDLPHALLEEAYRHFSAGNYPQAFQGFLAVLRHPNATEQQWREARACMAVVDPTFSFGKRREAQADAAAAPPESAPPNPHTPGPHTPDANSLAGRLILPLLARRTIYRQKR